MEYLLLLLSALLINRIIHHKLYKKSIIIMFWLIINSFVSPVIYYSFLDYPAYKSFSQHDYFLFCVLGLIFIFSTIVFTELVYSSKVIRPTVPKSLTCIKIKYLSVFYASIVLVFCFTYFIIYREGFPLQQILMDSYGGSLERPDRTGALPFYITSQCFFVAVIPLLYFYFKEKEEWRGIRNVIALFVVAFFSIVGGNKGVLAYIIIFIWIFEYNLKLNLKIVSMFIFAICCFSILMNYNTIYGFDIFFIIQAICRRFFVTQGATLLNTLSLYNSGHLTSTEFAATEVYHYIYGVYGGSAPCFYLGNMILTFGYSIGTLLSLTVLFLLLVIGNFIDGKGYIFMYQKWPFYFLMYLLGNSSFTTSFFLRMFVLFISMIILNTSSESKIMKKRRLELVK